MLCRLRERYAIRRLHRMSKGLVVCRLGEGKALELWGIIRTVMEHYKT